MGLKGDFDVACYRTPEIGVSVWILSIVGPCFTTTEGCSPHGGGGVTVSVLQKCQAWMRPMAATLLHSEVVTQDPIFVTTEDEKTSGMLGVNTRGVVTPRHRPPQSLRS